MDIATPAFDSRNGRRLRARDFGLTPDRNISFEGNQSFPKSSRSFGKSPFANPRIPLWRHALLNAADSGSCSFSTNPCFSSMELSQDCSLLTGAEDSYQENLKFANGNPYRGIVTVDALTTQILITNSIMTEITGYSSGELQTMKLSDLILKETSNYVLQDSDECSSQCKMVEIISKDGLRIGVSMWSTKTEVEDSSRLIIMVEPVRRVIAQFHMDEYGTVMDADELAYLVFDCTKDDFVQHNIQKWIPGIKLPQPDGSLTKAMRKQETTGCTKNRSFPLMLLLNYYEGESEINTTGPLPYYTAIIWLFSSISGLITINDEGYINDANPLFSCLALGYSREDLIDKPISDVILDFPDPEEVRSGEYHENAVHANGSMFPIRYYVEGPYNVSSENRYHVWVSWTQGNLASLSSLTWQLTQNSSFSSNASRVQETQDSKPPAVNKTPGDTSIFSDEGFSGEFAANYRTGRQIGKGGFGYVVLCQRKSDEETFVAKCINKAKVYPESWIKTENETLPHEIHFLSKIHHKNIVNMIEYMENPTYFQIVMEKHGPGIDLFEFIERTSGVDENLASYIFRQLIDAVQYLHSLNILHRDIKDENIIIDEKFQIKLIDFGSAAEFNGEKLFSVFCGTFEYCSPEVLRGKPYRGPELEIWSLGVTLYVLVFGCNPFANIEETIKAVLRFPSSLSSDLEYLLNGMLQVVVPQRLSLGEVAESVWMNQAVDVSSYDFETLVNPSKLEDSNVYNDPQVLTSTPFKKQVKNVGLDFSPARLILPEHVDN